jgi:hypothetical protein
MLWYVRNVGKKGSALGGGRKIPIIQWLGTTITMWDITVMKSMWRKWRTLGTGQEDQGLTVGYGMKFL